ncbi:MAG: hypothetical protein ACE5EK_02880, partial [Nitrospinales bacterium]
ELFSNPAFICLFLTILITVVNVMIGVSILPKDKRKRGYKLHSLIFWVVVVFYALFLISNHKHSRNSWFNYFVLLYLLIGVQGSRRINVTLHAIVASVGLVMLNLVAFLQLT